MPRGDATGPRGAGPRTGRGMGPCQPNGQPIPVSRPVGGGLGRGLGPRGLGLGRGLRGRGRGNRWFQNPNINTPGN